MDLPRRLSLPLGSQKSALRNPLRTCKHWERIIYSCEIGKSRNELASAGKTFGRSSSVLSSSSGGTGTKPNAPGILLSACPARKGRTTGCPRTQDTLVRQPRFRARMRPDKRERDEGARPVSAGVCVLVDRPRYSRRYAVSGALEAFRQGPYTRSAVGEHPGQCLSCRVN